MAGELIPDSSRALKKLLAILYRSFGHGPMSRSELIDSVRDSLNASGSAADGCLLSLVTRGYLFELPDKENFILSERGLHVADEAGEEPGDGDISWLGILLTPEEEAKLLASWQSLKSSELPPQEIHAVTRTFLREVLQAADIPDELLDAIFQTYQTDGRLTMSEDGGQYKIMLVKQ